MAEKLTVALAQMNVVVGDIPGNTELICAAVTEACEQHVADLVVFPELAKEDVGHDWWTVDLCFWPEAWPATEKCKNALDQLVSKYG